MWFIPKTDVWLNIKNFINKMQHKNRIKGKKPQQSPVVQKKALEKIKHSIMIIPLNKLGIERNSTQ